MIRVRIAPSPTGDPHVGTAYMALFNWVFARQNKGKFIVRIEDTDKQRYVPGAEENILNSLKWLGLCYNEGPDINGPFGPYRQSERLHLYQNYAHQLVEKGKAYYCFCSPQRLQKIRQEQQKKHLSPHYDGKCRSKSLSLAKKRVALGEPFVVRLKVPQTGETKFKDLIRGEIVFQNKLIDDQILLKSDSYPTYHLAVVIDDYLMKISHVIRAEEWLSSTPKHILLYQSFGWKIPFFAHMPLLRNSDRSKISKRKNPVNILWYRDQGYLPESFLNFLALMGWSHPQEKEIFDLFEMRKYFSFERIVKSGPVFNLQKLDWLNGKYIRETQNSKLKTQIFNFLERKYPEDIIGKIIPLIKTRIKKLSEFWNLTDFFFTDKVCYDSKTLVPKRKTKAETKKIMSNIKCQISNVKDSQWNAEKLQQIADKIVKENNWSRKDLFMLLRVAISGKTITPPLFESMEVLGRQKTLQRIQGVLQILT